MTADYERQARRWTRWFPAGWRDHNEEAFLETLISSALDERLDRADLVRTGVRLWGDVASRALDSSWQAARAALLTVSHYALAVQVAVTWAMVNRMVAHNGWVISRQVTAAEGAALVVLAVAWTIAMGCAISGHRRAGRSIMTALSAVALLSTAGRVALTSAPLHSVTVALLAAAVAPTVLAWLGRAWTEHRMSRIWYLGVGLLVGSAPLAFPDVQFRMHGTPMALYVLWAFGALVTIFGLGLASAARGVAPERATSASA